MNRRTKLGPILIASIITLLAGQVAVAQVDWAFGDPAVFPGPPGSWNEDRNALGDVVFDGTNYHMYLIGGQGSNPLSNSWSVGHWTLNDGTGEWDPDPCNPVLVPGAPGEWDSYSIGHIAVLHDGSEFRMWYGATASLNGIGNGGYATNTDGACAWDKHPGNPLVGLDAGPPGSWDENGTWPSSVLFDGSTYRMWFVGSAGDTWDGTWDIGYATSNDGLVWTRHADPVLEATEPWEDDKLYYPEVIPTDGGFAMWYSGLDMSIPIAYNGYAVSPDGLNWSKWPDNPVMYPNYPSCNAVDSMSMVVEGDMIHGWIAHCFVVIHVTSPFELVFFDGFESGETDFWGGSNP